MVSRMLQEVNNNDYQQQQQQQQQQQYQPPIEDFRHTFDTALASPLGAVIDQFEQDNQVGFGQQQIFPPCPPLQPVRRHPQPAQALYQQPALAAKHPRFTTTNNTMVTNNSTALRPPCPNDLEQPPKRRTRSSQQNNNNDGDVENNDPNGHNNDESDGDETVPSVVYNGKPVTIPTLKADIRDELIRVWTNCEDLRKKNHHLRRANTELEENCKSLKDTNTKLAKENSKFGKNDGVVLDIDKVVKMNIFPFVKFVTDEKQELGVASKIYRIIQQNKTGSIDPTIDPDHKTVWINTYAETTTSLLNGMRGYSQERMRVSTFKFYRTNGFLPTVEELRLCALREIDTKNKRLVTIYEWYTTDLFAKAIGQKQWPKSEWYKAVPMKAGNTNFKGLSKIHVPLFSPSMEAFLIIGYDNNLSRWTARVKHYEEKKDWDAALPVKKGKDAAGNKIPDPIHDGKYSSSDSGLARFGSWTDEGINNFKGYMKEINDKRKKDKATLMAMVDFEKAFITYLRKEHNVGAGTTRKGRKRKAGEDQVVTAPIKASSGEELDEDIFG